MKNFFIAIQVEDDGRYYAYVLRVSETDNLLAKLNIENIKIASICKTKKEASKTVECWNAVHKANKNYMFDSVSF